MKEILRTEQLVKNYPKKKQESGSEEIKVLKQIDLSINENEYVGIMGRSGCGKTTLLKILGLIERQTSGKVFFEGTDTKTLWESELADIRRRKIGFVFQDFYLMDSLSVIENIMLPMILDKVSKEECLQKGKELAEQLGLQHLLNKYPHELSGGEKQRVAISRALIHSPEVIFADEPTGNLDSKSGEIVINEFQKMNEEWKKTVVMVTHDPKMASYCKRIIFLKDGFVLREMHREGSREQFYHEILQYMQEL